MSYKGPACVAPGRVTLMVIQRDASSSHGCFVLIVHFSKRLPSNTSLFPPSSFLLPPVCAVPSAVHVASLAGEEPRLQAPRAPDAVAPTDLNKTATELADWLVLITQMLKSNIVTVGDTEEIRTTMGRLQVVRVFHANARYVNKEKKENPKWKIGVPDLI